MKIHEYQAKAFFEEAGIRVPAGSVVTNSDDARKVAEQIGAPVVVKAQVLVGGRGKAGGVKIAKDPAEAQARAAEILGMDIKGETVEKVLVTEAVDIAKEIYVGIILDRRSQKPHLRWAQNPRGGNPPRVDAVGCLTRGTAKNHHRLPESCC